MQVGTRERDSENEGPAMQDNVVIFPQPLPGERTAHPGYHLPAPLTPLVGREQDVAAVCALLSRPEVRLVTLTGTGDVGKTRVALEVAAFLQETFANGALFVPLAALRDPELVLYTLAEFLGLRAGRAAAPLELLSLALHEKHMLALLDNFEQLLEAASQLIDLLQACPRLTLLVTSRAVLHVQGEHEYPVMPLTLPDRQRLDDLQALSQCAAVTLFFQRVQTRVSGFSLTSTNARAVAEICLRLDGLPLALELAAARSKLLPPQALLDRLSQRLALLTSPALHVPARQQPLRNTLDWSYDLLNVEEQRLFRRLSVFVGGCQLQAAEAVCIRLPGDEDPGTHEAPFAILAMVGSLIDKSLVQQTEVEGGEPRLTMLETIREYGWESLLRTGGAGAAQPSHALSFLTFPEAAPSPP